MSFWNDESYMHYSSKCMQDVVCQHHTEICSFSCLSCESSHLFSYRKCYITFEKNW